MSYQVLARKWRPKSFSEVVGQEQTITVLSNALSLGRVHHAYLFSGTRGVGKTSIARLLAKGLNCERGVTATPCGECDNCRDIEQGRFVDLLEIDAASRTKVEDTRELLDNIQYLPTKGRFKVYLIDEVHMLSRSSFNALLKTLEEPPEHVKFLLATTDPQKLPITILSRCLHLHLNVLDSHLIQQQLIKILQAEQINQDDKAVQLLAKAANGSMRDALSLTDQAIALGNGQIDLQSVRTMLGTLDRSIPFTLVEALYQGNGNALMQQLESATKQGVDWDNLLVETIALLHQISFLQIIPTAIGDYSDFEERIRYLAHYIAPNDIQLFYQILLNGRKELAYAPDKKMGVEMSFLRALAFVPKVLQSDTNSDTSSSSSVQDATKTKIAKKKPLIEPKPQVEQDSPVVTDRTEDAPAMMAVNSVTAKSPVKEAPELKRSSSNDNNNRSEALDTLSDATKTILAARQQLIDNVIENEKKPKKSKQVDLVQPAKPSKKGVKSASQEKSAFAEASDKSQMVENGHKVNHDDNIELDQTAENYQWQFSEHFTPVNQSAFGTKTARLACEEERTAELEQKLIEEAVKIDPWSAEIESLTLPPLIKQIMINAFLQTESDSHLILHLRSESAHLINNRTNIKRLSDILSGGRQKHLSVEVIIDDDTSMLTPKEIREKIYQTKLTEAKKQIHQDNKVAMICQFFEAKIDDESIRPV